MRAGWLIAVLLIAGCASEKLALTPSPGVNFSGHWKLNEADSDDPQRVVLSQNVGPRPAPTDPAGKAAPGGSLVCHGWTPGEYLRNVSGTQRLMMGFLLEQTSSH